jgi:hypothetical protein
LSLARNSDDAKGKKMVRIEELSLLDSISDSHDVPTGRLESGEATEMSRERVLWFHPCSRIVKSDETVC